MSRQSIVSFGLLLVVVLIHPNHNQATSPPRRCQIPSVMWCDTKETAKLCSVEQYCAKYNRTVKNKPIKLTLLYEALCPDCKQFTSNILYPEIWSRLRQIVDIEMVPFGNAQETKSSTGVYSFTCQHGPKECQMNALHSCAIKHMKSINSWFPFLACLEQQEDPSKAVKSCFRSQRVTKAMQTAILSCQNGKEGMQLQHAASQRTKQAEWPQKHKFVPWLVINAVSTEHLQDFTQDIYQFLCRMYRGTKTPLQCKVNRQHTDKHRSFGRSRKIKGCPADW